MHNKIIYLSLFHYGFCPLLLLSVFVFFLLFSFLFFSFLLYFLAFSFYLSFLLSLTLIIAIFRCLIYTSSLLHVITAHLVSHPSLSSIVFIISMLITGIFYSLNYILLLLHFTITDLVIDFKIAM